LEARSPKWKKRPVVKADTQTELLAALADLNVSALLLQLLWTRDPDHPDALRTAEAIRAFLTADQTPLPDPNTLVGMEAAVAAIEAALDANERIAVWGDFDADGVTSVTLLTQALRTFGAQVEPYVPHRIKEGYGLNTDALSELAKSGVKLVITVDCGVSNREEAAHAEKLGLNLVITDHHNTSGDIPQAKAVINPKLGADPAFHDLAGVGVAYQVVRALVTKRGKPPALRNADLLELVALGTVADMANLHAANRTLVLLGLGCLNKTRRVGLLELLKAARHTGPITSHTIGYILGPRLNAVGRMDDARAAYELLLTADARKAADLAGQLEEHNRKRVAATKTSLEQAQAMVRGRDDSEKPILVRNAQWEPGVVGLVAGRLCEEFHRPAIAIAEGAKASRGSARSTRHFDIHAALLLCRDEGVFEGGRMGGHPRAAGFTILNENIEALHEQLLELADSDMSDEDLTPELTADVELTLEQCSLATLGELNRLEPFGIGNAPPLFVARNLQVLEAGPLKEDSPHLRLKLGAPNADADVPPVEAIWWSGVADGREIIARKPPVDVMFTLEARTWKDETTARLLIKAARPSKGAA
jgi:single-stranded-DNA-specific exonuclease